MDDLQTDTLSDFVKNPESNDKVEDKAKESENACTAALLNGSDEIDDPLDLMDNCENECIGSPNSDVWKGSDSEEESFENKGSEQQNNAPQESTESSNTQQTKDTGEETIEEEPKEEERKEANKDNAEKDEDSVKAKASVDTQEESQTSAEQADKDIPDKDENPDKDTSVVDLAEKDPLSGDVSEKDAISSDVTEKDAVSKDVSEEDPLSGDVTEKDPLSGDVTEKDPLAGDVAEKDPLAADVAEKDPLVDNEPEKDPLSGGPPDLDGQDEDGHMDYNDDDDDFDPSLLCPEVSMAIDECPVITNIGPVPNSGIDSPLPYEPVFSTFVDEVTGAEVSFNLNPEEQELRRRLYGPTNPVQLTKVHCTACNTHLGSALDGQNNRFVHPLLKVLICKECYHFYTSGEFEKDEDGSELYCRWCGQGGQVLCCSKCEFVFCKRCIRNNFGRKKMFEIRDSDNWDCFRCAPAQLITQRVACYEFFEWVRREMARASTLNPADKTDLWSKDHTRCCLPKKRSVGGAEVEKKPKKRKSGDVDPDYDPLAMVQKSPLDPTTPIVIPSNPMITSTPVVNPMNRVQAQARPVMQRNPISLVPRFTMKPKDNDIEFVRTIPAPQVQLRPINRPIGGMPGYRTILPAGTHIRSVASNNPPALVRLSSQPAVPTAAPTPRFSSPNRILNRALVGNSPNASSMMKHEWFEKTVRAAARVNSHLSYTLTQLNKAQSQAGSVEELAVVHNKLQEILSSSINSLIQIRKNLRTEFIAGIKTVRLPSKKVETFNNDDDVIFVSAPSNVSTPSTSQAKPAEKDPLAIPEKPVENGTKSSVQNGGGPKPAAKGYLKVKSVMELQNVPSECITIPDDPPKKDEASAAEKETAAPSAGKVICNGDAKLDKSKQKDEDKDKKQEEKKKKEEKKDKKDGKKDKKEESKEKKDGEKEKDKEKEQDSSIEIIEIPSTPPKSRRSKDKSFRYNMKEEPDAEVKRMLSVSVKIAKVDLGELQKRLVKDL